jgi:UDP-2,3-diacylglucosamine hydrolase
MIEKPFFVVSDVHLGAVPRSTEVAFRAFLASARLGAAGLLVNGDLFDFWFEYRTVIPREHYRVLAALTDVVESGVPVWFMGGNHDAWGGDFLEREVGVRLVHGPTVLELAGRRALVAHGDGLGTGDLKYRLLKRVIRGRLAVAAFRRLHPDLGARIAGLASTTESKAGNGSGEGKDRGGFIGGWARDRLLADPSLDLVLTGHAHRPVVEEVAPGRYHANSGDWIHHYSYLEIGPGDGPPRLMRWGAGGPEPFGA